MEDLTRSGRVGELNLASRRVEEADVIEKTAPSPSLLWDSQPLPAYQYFENVRNFLVAVQELKLPNFEASVFERENLEVGSSTKVVDRILALKDYHEWKQMTGGNRFYKPPRSHIIVRSSGRIDGRDSAMQLDMSGGTNKALLPLKSDIRKLEEAMVKALAQHMSDAKENMDSNLAESNRSGNVVCVASMMGKVKQMISPSAVMCVSSIMCQ
ncbi:hypothetical protein CASFOL_031883 [Castilleja foliolosa]|uniref:Uncharacterized protein n=1 Tax=Castilleja foliolosa TaxID=1961234 RepID=A0ABD3C0H6_9LAMI